MPSSLSAVYRSAVAFLIVPGVAAGCADVDGASNGPSATTVTSAAPNPTGEARGTAGPEQVPTMFVLEANSGAATPIGDSGTYELTLSGVAGVTWFADRPQRGAGEKSLARFVEAWPSRFADSPPKALLR